MSPPPPVPGMNKFTKFEGAGEQFSRIYSDQAGTVRDLRTMSLLQTYQAICLGEMRPSQGGGHVTSSLGKYDPQPTTYCMQRGRAHTGGGGKEGSAPKERETFLCRKEGVVGSLARRWGKNVGPEAAAFFSQCKKDPAREWVQL